jgi:aminoglycoside phosphotransferase family enzyme/predicted kinase
MTTTSVPTNLAGIRSGRADVHETHCAVVFLLGERAYKVKKAVDLGFLDFRTVAERERVCRREVELNRRLSPDVYLGVGHLTGPGHDVAEPVVVMRRMPDQLRLSTLVRAGASVDEPVRRLARLVADFHARAETSPDIARQGGQAALRGRWIDNLRETDRFRGRYLEAGLHDEIERLALRYLDGRGPLFAAREEAGLVRDGHGDLIADDIFCLPDGPRVLDCLEFDDRLRHIDVLDDVAFLAMDLERLGAPELARRFLDWYTEVSRTPTSASLEHHYIAYRAFVRAKVACLAADQGVDHAASRAVALTDLALRHLHSGAVTLLVVGGIPGAGKTTLCSALAQQLGWTLLRSDEVRRELFDVNAADRYSAAATATTYAELLRRGRSALSHGASVILDATWPDAATRSAAAQLGDQTCSDLVELECRLPVETAARRAGLRFSTSRDASEADSEVARNLASIRDPWPTAIAVDTSMTPAHALTSALKHLQGPAPQRVWPRPRMLPD